MYEMVTSESVSSGQEVHLLWDLDNEDDLDNSVAIFYYEIIIS